MLDAETHQAFIDRHHAAVKKTKDDVTAAVLRVVTPRRLLSDPDGARELFMATAIRASRSPFKRIAANGAELARVKNA